MTTIHANTPRDALARLETMIAMANLRISDKAMRQQICSAIHLIIQVSRLSDGTRKVMSVSEVDRDGG
jgi:pilus assembly protein CpaF